MCNTKHACVQRVAADVLQLISHFKQRLKRRKKKKSHRPIPPQAFSSFVDAEVTTRWHSYFIPLT